MYSQMPDFTWDQNAQAFMNGALVPSIKTTSTIKPSELFKQTYAEVCAVKCKEGKLRIDTAGIPNL